MALCASKTSAAIVQPVPPGATELFVEWQRGITTAASNSVGYLGTDIYPPADGQSTEWITVLHFEDHASLERWIDSDERKWWIGKLPAEVGAFEVKRIGSGFGPWFEKATLPGVEIPPWKMALTVALSLYPTLMLLNVFVMPWIEMTGYSYSRLIGNALSVVLLQWLVVPAVKVPLRRWLEANSPDDRTFSWSVGVGIVLGLIALAGAFRMFVG